MFVSGENHLISGAADMKSSGLIEPAFFCFLLLVAMDTSESCPIAGLLLLALWGAVIRFAFSATCEADAYWEVKKIT